MYITTATGKQYIVRWCAIASIDGVLRFCITGESVANLIPVFMNPEETSIINYHFDETVTEYEGFTVFKGLDLQLDGNITISLMKG